MNKLPFWHLTNKYPSFQDVDSKTAVEMVGKIYGAMNELIEETNKFQEDVNNVLSDNKKCIDEFKVCITDIVQNYMKVIENKILFQDLKIDKAVENAIADGKIKAVGQYDETTESLDIVISYDKGETE